MFRTNQPNQANHPPIAELQELRDRLFACEKKVAEQNGADRLCALISTLVDKFVLRETLRVEIVRWPQHFARQLLLASVKCDATIRETARLHTELLHDIARAQEVLELAASCNDAPLLQRKTRDSVLALRRQLQYRRKDLQELGVTITEVTKGDPFNPTIHEPVSTEAAGPELQDTIADACSPLYSWTDEQGLEQHVPAQVVVHSANGQPPGGSRCLPVS